MALTAAALRVAPPDVVSLLLVAIITIVTATMENKKMVTAQGGTTWCVARSDANNQALQTALDYACGAGADCVPIQSNGLCYLPNTIQAHASFAFNSFFQRKGRAPGSCNFAGTSTIAQTDPSYGSCVYPSSASTAGETNTASTTPSMSNPNNEPTSTPTTASPIYGGGGADGLTPGMNPAIPDSSKAPSKAITTSFLIFFSSLVILSLTS